MTKALEKGEIMHLAKLSSLSLTDDELAIFGRDLTNIVAHIATLSAVDVEGVPPTLAVTAKPHAMREDVPRESLSHEDALAAAPSEEDGGFAVPTFVES